MQEARNALQEVVPDLDRHITEKSIEVAGHDWFLNGGSFDFSPGRQSIQGDR